MKDNKMFYTVLSILVAIMGWFGTVAYGKLTEIEKSLLELKIEVVKMQTTMIDRDMVVQIVSDELAKRGIK